MPQSRCPNLGALQVRIGDLERHPDRQGQVGEVTVTGLLGLLLIEIDPADRIEVVELRIAQGEDRVHGKPGHRDAHQAQARQLPWAKVRSPDEVAADPHLHTRGFYQPIELFPGEQVAWPGLPWQGLPSALHNPGHRTRTPHPGEDTERVLGQLPAR